MAVIVDYSQLKDFEAKLRKANLSSDVFFESCAKELAARLLARVKEKSSEYAKTGNLMRGWTAGQEVDANGFVNSIGVVKTGNTYTISVTNNVEYAPYVEYGHRTPGGKDWVKGKHTLQISEHEIQMQSSAILQNKLEKFLREASV